MYPLSVVLRLIVFWSVFVLGIILIIRSLYSWGKRRVPEANAFQNPKSSGLRKTLALTVRAVLLALGLLLAFMGVFLTYTLMFTA